jgi:hypothetical protein
MDILILIAQMWVHIVPNQLKSTIVAMDNLYVNTTRGIA